MKKNSVNEKLFACFSSWEKNVRRDPFCGRIYVVAHSLLGQDISHVNHCSVTLSQFDKALYDIPTKFLVSVVECCLSKHSRGKGRKSSVHVFSGGIYPPFSI